MFGSRWSDVKTCTQCSYSSNSTRTETAWFINISQLPPNSTLDEHIANSFQSQLMTDFSCPGCQQKNTVYQNSHINRSAQQLIVVLSRFEYNRQLRQPQKLTQPVVFGGSLDLTKYSNNTSSPRLQYRLHAVIQHQHRGPPVTYRPRPEVEKLVVEPNTTPEWAERLIQRAEALQPGGSAGIGVSADSGHYRAVMLGPDGHWREIEDDRVDPHATVDNAVNPAGVNWTPYVLLYERLPPSQVLEQPSKTNDGNGSGKRKADDNRSGKHKANDDNNSGKRKAKAGDDSARKAKRARPEKPGGTVVGVGGEESLPKKKLFKAPTSRKPKRRAEAKKRRPPPIVPPEVKEGTGMRVKRARWWKTIPSSPPDHESWRDSLADDDAGRSTSGNEDDPIIPWRIELPIN